MTNQANPLMEFSNAVAALSANAGAMVAAIRISEQHHLTGTLWRAGVIVASEQSLPRLDAFEVVLPGGAAATANLVGRDNATNLAVLKLAQPAVAPTLRTAEPCVGALAIAIGSDGSGGTTARLGAINTAGPAWQSSRGGRIDRRIIVDARLARSEEGGPVLDCAGATLGVSCFGPRRQLIVIPSSTIDRIAPILLADGHVARGWLGAALQPVALPDALKPAAGHATGMMVMSIADGGPSAKAGVLAGDILVAVGGEPAQRFRRIAALLGPESIGKEIALKLIRSGAIVDFKATVTARPVT